MFNSLIRVKLRLILMLIVAVFVLTLGSSVRPAFAIPSSAPTNVQFHIGCSSFWASADATTGFKFGVSEKISGFSIFRNQAGVGHFTLSGNYGTTFSQGTVLSYIYGDISNPYRLGTVACSDSGYQGPGIPAGFVLLTITCNTPVYTNPDGSPSGSNAITAGQTWYVNPMPMKDAKGNLWTEVFVSSYNDPFIPTSCLGGAPAK